MCPNSTYDDSVPPAEKPPTRRLTITLRRGPWLGIRPTIVIEGRGQPTQWGVGTWQVPADRATTVSVFLHVRGITWARASRVIESTDAPTLEYRAPWVPFRPGRLR